MMKMFLNKIKYLLSEYPAIVAAIIIYGYYLFTTISFFQKPDTTDLGFVDFIFQFDSLIFLWLIAYLFIKSQQVSRKYNEQKQATSVLVTEAEKSRIASNVLNEVVKQLQDRINNPLTIIATHSDYIRKKVNSNGDQEINRKLDVIDISLQRVHHAIQDVASYKSNSILEELQTKIKQ